MSFKFRININFVLYFITVFLPGLLLKDILLAQNPYDLGKVWQ